MPLDGRLREPRRDGPLAWAQMATKLLAIVAYPRSPCLAVPSEADWLATPTIGGC